MLSHFPLGLARDGNIRDAAHRAPDGGKSHTISPLADGEMGTERKSCPVAPRTATIMLHKRKVWLVLRRKELFPLENKPIQT